MNKPNWAQEFYSMLIGLCAGGRDYRAAHANRGTPPKTRWGRSYATDYAGGAADGRAGRLIGRQFQVSPEHETRRKTLREQMDATSVERIAGPKPTPHQLQMAKLAVAAGYRH